MLSVPRRPWYVQTQHQTAKAMQLIGSARPDVAQASTNVRPLPVDLSKLRQMNHADSPQASP